jgi:hypothetical protein
MDAGAPPDSALSGNIALAGMTRGEYRRSFQLPIKIAVARGRTDGGAARAG